MRVIRQALIAAALVLCAAGGLAVAGVHPALGGGGDHRVTICHHVEGNGNTGNGYNIETVDKDAIVNVDGVLNGHGLHELDIIPAFAAGSSGSHEWGSFPGRGDAALIDSNCGATETTTTGTTTTETTTGSTTTDTTTTTETTTQTTTTTPSPPCPNDEPPIHGQNGDPGNDVCNPCAPPVNIEKCPPPNDSTTITTTTNEPPGTTTTNEPPVTTTVPPVTTTEQGASSPPPVKHKPPKSKPKPHSTPKKMPPVCPVGKPANSPFEPCAVQGSG